MSVSQGTYITKLGKVYNLELYKQTKMKIVHLNSHQHSSKSSVTHKQAQVYTALPSGSSSTAVTRKNLSHLPIIPVLVNQT